MELIRPHLYLGSRNTINRRADLLNAGVTAILNVADDVEHDPLLAREFRCLSVGLKDGPGSPPYLVDVAASVLGLLLREGETVLCHCRAGHHRSPTVVALHLCKTECVSFGAAWREVRSRRPGVWQWPTCYVAGVAA